MTVHKITSGLLLGGTLLCRVAFPGVALAAHSHDGSNSQVQSSTTSSSPSPSPSATPAASPDPSPSPTPSPSASPKPTDDPAHGSKSSSSPSPSASPDPSPSATPTTGAGQTGAGQTGAGQTGPNSCTGVVPTWVFDTSSGQWQNADASSFTCDMTTGLWLSPEYYYDQQDGWYEIIPQAAVASLPSYMVTAPNVVHTQFGDLTVGSPGYQVAQALGLLDPTGGILESNTGPGSNNQATTSNNNQNWVDLTSLVNVINTLQSGAASGNVGANSNTQVGSAATGAASVVANLINLLASAWSWSNGNLSFFMQNICGDQLGSTTTCNNNVNLNPTSTASGSGGTLGGTATTSSTGPNSTNTAGTSNTSGLNVNAQSTGSITNNVNLAAASGNASANSNTSAGNVSSGPASAEINILNLINSMITSGNSFFGILNIFGNLNGDVLFPSGFLNGLLTSGSTPTSSAGASNTGPGSNNQASISNAGQATVNNTNNEGISNNLGLNADSGTASASSNTSTGNVGTGSSNTTESLFNLANSSIFGNNAVLVIVNVLGHWIGKIMNLPGGNTESALLTDNATVGSNQTGPNSKNNTAVNNTSNANINQQSDGTITNNVNVNALSGDASAKDNTAVGNVTSGKTNAVASVANIFNSVLNVSHWFGVLVINVFGNWVGSVGTGTPGSGSGPTQSSATTTDSQPTTIETMHPMSISSLGGVGGVSAPTSSSDGNVAGDSTQTSVADGGTGKVLTAADQQTASPATEVAGSQGKDISLLLLLSAFIMLVAGALVSIDKRLQKK
jgi:hypothetical protein